MNFKKLVMGGVAAAVLATSGVATAGDVEANVALSTDYLFRGVSQTGNDPAISGGLDYSIANGFYVGIWASNVEFEDVSTEIDLYGGWAGEISEGVELDLGYIYYAYPGDSGGLNYSEFTAGVSFGDLGFGLIYSPDYFGTDQDVVIFNVDYSVAIAKNLNLDLHSGFSVASDTDDENGVDIGIGNLGAAVGDDYVDYSIGLSTTSHGLDLSIAWVDTNISSSVDDELGAEDRIVFTVGKSF